MSIEIIAALGPNVIELQQQTDEVVLENTGFATGDFVTDSDPRLYDSRTPLSHSFSHYIGGSDQLTPADIGAQPSGNYVLNSDTRLYDSRFPTPHSSTHNISGSDPISPSDIGAQPLLDPKAIVKGWVNFNGINMTVNSSFNIASVTFNATGDYTITLASPINLAKYCFVGWSRDWNTDNTVVNGLSAKSNSLKSSTSFRVLNNNPINGFNYNSPEISIIIFSPN